jgi:CDP-diacylglycerol--serine O-phosphatidyltransferase
MNKTNKFGLIGYYNYTVILTNLSLISSVFGIYMAMQGHVETAVYCLMVSGFCDMFDGKVARTKDRCEAEQRFGIQLDSLSDLVCFGVLPTVIGYAIGMTERLAVFVFFIYVMAALTRLAYFNVMEEERQSKTPEKRKSYTGLPVTAVALIIPLIYIVGKFVEIKFHLLYGACMLVIALAFVLPFQLKKPGNVAAVVMVLIGILEVACMIRGFHYGG